MICQHRDCRAEAHLAVKVCIPAVGEPEAVPARAAFLVDLVLCEQHLDEADALAFLEVAPATFEAFAHVALAGARPDWRGAYVVGISLNSPEYRALMDNRAETVH